MTRLTFVVLVILVAQVGALPKVEAQSPSCPKNVRQC